MDSNQVYITPKSGPSSVKDQFLPQYLGTFNIGPLTGATTTNPTPNVLIDVYMKDFEQFQQVTLHLRSFDGGLVTSTGVLVASAPLPVYVRPSILTYASTIVSISGGLFYTCMCTIDTAGIITLYSTTATLQFPNHGGTAISPSGSVTDSRFQATVDGSLFNVQNIVYVI